MKWFRLYSSVLQDPKVQRLSPALFKHWINLLCLANESEPRGLLPCVEDIAFALRIKPSEAATMMTQLRRAGLVDQTREGRDFPHNWPQRQRKSDDIAARVDEHRKREAAKQGHSSDDAGADVTLHETLLKRSVDTDTEKETDTETDTETDRDITGDSESDGHSIIVADALASGDDDSAPHAPDNAHLSEPTPDVTAEKPPAPAKIALDAPAMRLAIQLREAVLAHNSTALDARKAMTGQGIQAWARKIEALISDPRRAPPDVEAVIAYATSDTRFWQAIVLNPDKLKKHFDTINGQRLNARNGQNGGNGNGRHAENGRSAGGRYGSGSGNGRAGTGGASHPPVGTPEYVEWARARDAQLGIGVSGAASGPRTRATG